MVPLVRLEATRFPNRLQSVPEQPTASTGLYVLKSAAGNRKLSTGNPTILKGPWRGKPMYTLTLPERTTCWSGCQNWQGCYGNNMWRALRYEPGLELEAAIGADVTLLARRHPDGFVVRLHVLGDFYSEDYVAHWATLLVDHPEAHVFGYTHWPQDHPIGAALTAWVEGQVRVALLRSDGPLTDALPVAVTVGRTAEAAPGTILCPEQTGATAACTTCGLCMNHRTSVSFRDHS